MTELSDLDRLLEQLDEEERLLSARRARLHTRITYLWASGNADGSPASPEQLEALNEQERELSKARKDLHARIGDLRRRPTRR